MGDPAVAERRLIAYVTDAFQEACERTGFTPLVSAADRHGSLVWEAGSSDSLDRYITLAFTHLAEYWRDVPALEGDARFFDARPELRGSACEVYSVELSTTVEHDSKFLREVAVPAFCAVSHNPSAPMIFTDDRMGQVETVETLARYAQSVTEEMLTESYPFPRPRREGMPAVANR